ncbi:M23 family metallopeptidase [Microbacterium halophytorum]|uniref:M23 family metallopeptidase n=1 Tax=Microbacterium halophytorum TaxID=2067568 RepID=UPI000CFC09FF|nr:M23 family metallopeptidase [Microbacterium halophytorum]
MSTTIRRRPDDSIGVRAPTRRGAGRRASFRLFLAFATALALTLIAADPAHARHPGAVAERSGPTQAAAAVTGPLPLPSRARAAAGAPRAENAVAAAARFLGPAAPAGGSATVPTREPWVWPVVPVHVLAEFAGPAHDYAPGHRGMDLAAAGEIRSPAGGVVAFAGVVVDRPLVTIDHGDGLVTTLEPVESALSPGDAVAAGDAVGVVASGGHAPRGAVHFGVRLHGDYINPRLLLGGVPRAVLLPCCT